MSDASTTRRTRGWAGFLLAAVVGTLLSMARTGHVSGVGNNMFHLPLLAGLAGLPQFAHDPFIQTLPYYASGYWLALVGVAPGNGAFPLLLAMGFASRFLALVAFLACADAIGIRDLAGRLLFAVLIAFSSMMNGFSAAGDGGLFINYFTHSELANATNLLAIWCAARGRFTEAFACNGVTFFLNAFMAVWNAVPLGLIAVLLLMRREIGWRTLLWRSALGLIAFLILAAPVIHVITANPEFGRPIDFDYPTFLTEYYPDHFLIARLAPRLVLSQAVVTLCGLVAAFALVRREPRAAFCLVGLIGYILVWLIGAALPFLTHSPMLLNLHLLRSGCGIYLFGALALAMLTTLWARGPDVAERRIWAPLLAVVSATSRVVLPLTVLLIPLAHIVRLPPRIVRLRLDVAAAILLVLAAWPLLIAREARANAVLRGNVAAWRALGEWAKAHAPADAVFMIPIDKAPAFRAADPAQSTLATGYEVFETAAERRTWIDLKAGAAVMWNPNFYHLWHDRVAEVTALPDHAARMSYARVHGIGFVVDGCDAARPALTERDGRCVYAVGRVE